MERKLEGVCEIQNCCCGQTGIMIQLKLVKTKLEQYSHDADEKNENNNNNNTQNHCMHVILKFVKPNRKGTVACKQEIYWRG